MKRKHLAALAVAGAAAVGLGIHSAGATTLPMSGTFRTVATRSSFPGSWNLTGTLTVSNLSAPFGSNPPFTAPITVTCNLETREAGSLTWTPVDTDHVFIAGGLQSGQDVIDLEANVEATSRFNVRVSCNSAGFPSSEPTVVGGAAIAIAPN